MNKLDRKQKSHFEISSNESHLGQATWKKQKLALCKRNTLQEMRKLATIATRKPVLPKMAELSQPVSSPPHPWGLPSCSPADAEERCSYFWHPGIPLGLATAAVSTHLHIHHPHQDKLIQGNQERSLACEKGGVTPKTCSSENKFKPS